MRSRLLLATGFTVVAGLAFVAGRSSTKPNPPALEIRPGSGHWLQVWRDGELSSEWQPADGRIYGCLSALLSNEFLLLDENRGVEPKIRLLAEVRDAF